VLFLQFDISYSFGGLMKTFLLTKFENAINDLKSFITSYQKPPTQDQPTKIQDPKLPRKNTPQRTSSKEKSKSSERTINSRVKKMDKSQGDNVFSGSGYNGKGSPDHGKIRSNRKRR